MINSRMISQIIGILLLIETTMILLCSAVALFYQGDDFTSFLATAGVTAAAGLSFYLFGAKAEKHLSRRDGYIIVGLSWIIVSLFGMLPFYFSGYIPNITDAFFETISGFSSTGSTILDNIEEFPHGLLFWRSMTQWIGGLGIIFFTIAVLPIFGIGGVQLFAAEATGPTHDKVNPRIGVTAKWIWSIYIGLTATEAILLTVGGMPIFDSICHSFATTGTGGYSTKQASIAYYNSNYIEYVIAIFMFLSGINFTLLLLFINKKFKKCFQDTELKFYIGSVLFFTLSIASILYYTEPMGFEESFRKSFFQVASLHTSTGFATADYMVWKPVAWALLTITMLIGACAGSTSGGMKCIRVSILFKSAKNEFKRIMHPNAVLPVRVNKEVVPNSLQTTVFAFSFVYCLLIVISTLFLMALDINFLDSFGVIVSSIGNMGPGLGTFGPANSWSALPNIAKWLCSFLMLVGRLELFTILLMFTPSFWKQG